ncbi:MAG: VWA domain-containing protein [Schleiferiaceae bacterium]|nr:VWA domain-containing protein [Schleiferiaceae bacterium]
MPSIETIHFEDLFWLWGLLIIPVMVLYFVLRHKKRNVQTELANSSSVTSKGGFIGRFKPALFILRVIAIALLFIGMARPQTTDVNTKNKGIEGIDIIMALDVSTSMKAADFKPNRLEALKEVADEFVGGRPNDRIGVVIYAGESFTQTPLTSDHKIVRTSLEQLDFGLIKDGTAIGMGLATAVNRLKESKAKSKVIILISDGVNNAGFVNPRDAADLASKFNIKVYTIAVGKDGMAPFPVQHPFTGQTIYQNYPVEVDKELLEDIAKATDGKFFEAKNKKALTAIYEEINQMETTEIEEIKYYHYDEWFYYPVFAGLALLVLEFLLRFTLYKSFV